MGLATFDEIVLPMYHSLFPRKTTMSTATYEDLTNLHATPSVTPFEKRKERQHVQSIPVVPMAQPVTITHASGAVRSADAENVRYDLISPHFLEALAKTYAEGAKKYSDNNWLKGFPSSDLLNHALRHLNLWQTGDDSEDHLSHAAWNIAAIIHFRVTNPEPTIRKRVTNDCN